MKAIKRLHRARMSHVGVDRRIGRRVVGAAALSMTATALIWEPAGAQIVPRASIGTKAGTREARGGAEQQLKTGGPVANALPGCGQGGEPEYNFDAPPPPERKKLGASPGGVDMRAGQLMFQNTDLSIGGEGDAGLSLTRSFAYKSPNSLWRQAFGEFFTHNWDIQIQERRTPRSGACYPSQFNYMESVIFGDLSDTFRKYYNGTYFERTSSAGYAELNGTFSADGKPNNLVFTARDGTVVTFLPFYNTCGGTFHRCTFASSVKRPDGTLYSLEYDTPASGSGKRLRSVVSNRGFAFLFEYAGGGSFPSKICALNLAFTIKPADNICPAAARSAAYAYSGTVQTVATDMGNGTWTFTKPTASAFSITRPGEPQPYVVNNYSFVQGGLDDEPALVIDSQQLADGRTFSYYWNILYNDDWQGSNSQQVMGGSWIDGQGRSLTAAFGAYIQYQPPNGPPTYTATPGPESIIDELGRITSYDYCSAVYAQYGGCIIPPVKSATDPEGNKELYTYTAFNNVGQITRVAKPGSGLSNLVETRNFDFNAPPALKAKPTSVVDARNNTTSFTYDQTHGGVLTEKSPADANGVQTVKRSAYVQRSAWVSNGAGGFIQSSNPVYLLSEERTCRTTATSAGATGSAIGCVGGSSDEVVTSYDYGPDTGAVGNNLLLRGVAVTGDGVTRRTCYGYDAQGNRIWETKPRAGQAACY